MGPLVMCRSQFILADVQGAVKVAWYVEVAGVFDEIRDSVMTVQKYPHMAVGCAIAMYDFRKVRQDLCPVLDA